MIIISAWLLMGIIAGSYPAFVLSRFKPDTVLRGVLKQGSRGTVFRQVMVLSQFSISIILIIGTILFYKQLNYMKDQYLGFDQHQKLVLEFDRSRLNTNTYQAVKNEFLKHPSVKKVSFSSSVPGRWMYFWHLWPVGKRQTNNQMVHCFQVDDDFFELYKLQMVAGQSFSELHRADDTGDAWILNEAAVASLGWNRAEDALGNFINREENRIIGVAKNFHLNGLQTPIEPLAVFLMEEDFRYLTLDIDVNHLDETIAFVAQTFSRLCAGYIFNYFFLDADFDQQYRSEDCLSRIFLVFTLFGIFIACLGLFGLASYITQLRTREIGIRKVLGASVSTVTLLLSGEFIKWVLLANLVAWPVAWLGMDIWLQEFAYRTEMDIWPFILAALLAILIAAFTVSAQAVRAATANPADSLKYE